MYDLSTAEESFCAPDFSGCLGLSGCTSGWISSEVCGDWWKRLRRDLISSISMGRAVLCSALPFFLLYYCVFMRCLSDSLAAFHSLVYSVKTSFLSLDPLLFSQILLLFIFILQKLSILFLILYAPPPSPSKFHSTLPRFLFSHSLTLSSERSYSARPGSCGFHANRLSGSSKSKEPRARDRQNERESEGFHRLHRTAFVLKSTATIPRTPTNGTTQNRNTSQQNTKQLLLLDNIHTV